MGEIQRKISTLKLLQKAIYTVALFLLVLLLLIQVSIKIGIYIFKKVGRYPILPKYKFQHKTLGQHFAK